MDEVLQKLLLAGNGAVRVQDGEKESGIILVNGYESIRLDAIQAQVGNACAGPAIGYLCVLKLSCYSSLPC